MYEDEEEIGRRLFGACRDEEEVGRRLFGVCALGEKAQNLPKVMDVSVDELLARFTSEMDEPGSKMLLELFAKCKLQMNEVNEHVDAESLEWAQLFSTVVTACFYWAGKAKDAKLAQAHMAAAIDGVHLKIKFFYSEHGRRLAEYAAQFGAIAF